MEAPYFTGWLAYVKASRIAKSLSLMAIKRFPAHERYSLTDQIRRSSRSVGANLAESAGKSGYPKHFVSKLSDAISENYETQHWIVCAHGEGYIDDKTRDTYLAATSEVGRLLNFMRKNPRKFIATTPPKRNY